MWKTNFWPSGYVSKQKCRRFTTCHATPGSYWEASYVNHHEQTIFFMRILIISLVKGQQCNCIIRLFFMRICVISLVKGQQCNCIIRLFFMRICVISLVQGQQCNCIIRLFFMRICIISLVQGQALRERPKCNRKNLNLRGWLPSDQHILFTIF